MKPLARTFVSNEDVALIRDERASTSDSRQGYVSRLRDGLGAGEREGQQAHQGQQDPGEGMHGHSTGRTAGGASEDQRKAAACLYV
jgi:hypothetical protein